MLTGYMPDGSNADVSADQYHHYKVSDKFRYDTKSIKKISLIYLFLFSMISGGCKAYV